MRDYELELFDRLNVIKDTIEKYGEENFYLSFSGGKDSTILHYMLDMALPENKIPRIYVNTGISYESTNKFISELNDERIVIIHPSVPIRKTLEDFGYPFKSKHHSYMVEKYQRLGMIKGVKNYLEEGENKISSVCPKKLRYQFSKDFNIKISDLCCLKLKEEPLQNYAKEHNLKIAITGIMPDEGGRRVKAQCFVRRDKNTMFFNPLVKIDKEFEEWFIDKYKIKLCELYYPPFNFKRTGCKGCPFALELQNELDMMESLLPQEKRQCEVIWQPIYQEYRRLGYRLRKEK